MVSIVISIVLVTTVHCGAAQSSTNEMANSNPVITASAGVDGTISPSGVFSITYGGNQVFTVTPDKKYAIGQVLVNSTSALQAGIALVNPYSFTVQNITGTTTISATFATILSTDSSTPPSYPNLLNLAIVLVVFLSLFAVAVIVRHRKTANLKQ
jgi:hypothetical protein